MLKDDETFVIVPPNDNDYPYIHLEYLDIKYDECEVDISIVNNKWVLDYICDDIWCDDLHYDTLDELLDGLVNDWDLPEDYVPDVREVCKKLTPELIKAFIDKRNNMISNIK